MHTKQERPSPNFDSRSGQAITLLIVHYTGMPSAISAIGRLCDPASRVSAHYTIDEDGTIYQHVDESKRAWHAGRSAWREWRDVNSCSIGIELVNPGHQWGYRPFPEPQTTAFEWLATTLIAKHAIASDGVLGHSDIACWRKQDPGELFNWKELAYRGIGIWPCSEDGKESQESPDSALQGLFSEGSADVIIQLLSRYGYYLETQADWPLVLRAFQRHFHPERISGQPDVETIRRLRALIRASGR